MTYRIDLRSKDLGDRHPFVLPGRWELVPGSTIEGGLADGGVGIFTVLKASSKDSWLLSWACSGSARDGQRFELIKSVSLISSLDDQMDWRAEIVLARTAARAA